MKEDLLRTIQTRKGQYVIVDPHQTETEMFKECNKLFLLDRGEMTFLGYAVSWSGIANKERYDVPVKLYYFTDEKHIVGFQTAAKFDETYAFLA